MFLIKLLLFKEIVKLIIFKLINMIIIEIFNW